MLCFDQEAVVKAAPASRRRRHEQIYASLSHAQHISAPVQESLPAIAAINQVHVIFQPQPSYRRRGTQCLQCRHANWHTSASLIRMSTLVLSIACYLLEAGSVTMGSEVAEYLDAFSPSDVVYLVLSNGRRRAKWRTIDSA